MDHFICINNHIITRYSIRFVQTNNQVILKCPRCNSADIKLVKKHDCEQMGHVPPLGCKSWLGESFTCLECSKVVNVLSK